MCCQVPVNLDEIILSFDAQLRCREEVPCFGKRCLIPSTASIIIHDSCVYIEHECHVAQGLVLIGYSMGDM